MPMNYDKFFSRIGSKNLSKGINTNTLRKNKYIGESTLQRMRNGEAIRMGIICRLCFLLDCQPSDIMTYIKDEEDIKKVVTQ